ncbi:MAG: hypothetical protein E7301_06930 [Butyrivibrio sp.]|nr:hypothetical protein [Butyrivibrio sp.]
MKTWGLVAFEEFGDAMTERILLVRRTKSPKYIGKRADLLLLHFLLQRLGIGKTRMNIYICPSGFAFCMLHKKQDVL